MNTITFTVPGRLSGKGRPRFVRATGRTYTPEKTRSMEATVRSLASEAMAGRDPLTGPVSLTINIWITPPQSWSKRKRSAAYYVTGRPDCDNCGKLVADSMNGIVYTDDALVADLTIKRRYALHGGDKAVVTVEPLLLAGEFRHSAHFVECPSITRSAS